MCIIASVSPIGRDDTRAQCKASDPHERECCHIPGILIEPRVFIRFFMADREVEHFTGRCKLSVHGSRTGRPSKLGVLLQPNRDISLDDLGRKLRNPLIAEKGAQMLNARFSPIQGPAASLLIKSEEILC